MLGTENKDTQMWQNEIFLVQEQVIDIFFLIIISVKYHHFTSHNDSFTPPFCFQKFKNGISSHNRTLFSILKCVLNRVVYLYQSYDKIKGWWPYDMFFSSHDAVLMACRVISFLTVMMIGRGEEPDVKTPWVWVSWHAFVFILQDELWLSIGII